MEQLGGPAHAARIEKLAGAGDGGFRFGHPREPVIEQVRYVEQLAPGVQRGRAGQLHGVQLVQRIDLHELNAGILEHLLARNALEDLFHHAVVPGIAIVPGLLHELAIGAEKAEIHAPGIHADTVQRQIPLAHGHVQTVADLLPETLRVPAQRITVSYRGIGEAVQFVDLQLSVGKLSCDGAAALGPEIEGQVLTHERMIVDPRWGML